MNSTQSGSQDRDLILKAGEALAAGRLVKIASDGGDPVAKYPDDVADYALFVTLEAAAAAGDNVAVRPLSLGRQVRVTLNGTCAPGGVLTLAAINATDDGKVAAIGASDDFFIVGIALETGADEQSVLIQPCGLMKLTVA